MRRDRSDRPSPFDFTDEEWQATHELLLEAKAAQDERLAPDGYTVIWNCSPTLAMHTCTSSLASTTSRSQTKVGNRQSRSRRTDGPTRSDREAVARECLGGEPNLSWRPAEQSEPRVDWSLSRVRRFRMSGGQDGGGLPL
jgi:hypothetical protein